jgi:DNA-binding LytR/AlgR family response regulator
MISNGSVSRRVDTDPGYKKTRQISELSRQQPPERLTIAYRHPSGSPADSKSGIPLLSPLRWNSAKIAIKANGTILLLDPAEILAAEAQGNYVLIFHGKGSHLLREQISVLASRLRVYGLIRIHRSILVNAAHVESVTPLLTGEYLLRIKGGREYNVTRTYKKNLHALAQTWIGMEGFDAE